MTTIALFGAGGKMGYRLSTNFRASPNTIRHVEISEAGKERLKAGLGINTVGVDEALKGAEVVVLAVPDTHIGKVAAGAGYLAVEEAVLRPLELARHSVLEGDLRPRGLEVVERLRLDLGELLRFHCFARYPAPSVAPCPPSFQPRNAATRMGRRSSGVNETFSSDIFEF